MSQAHKGIPPNYLDIDLSPYAGRYIALVEGRILAVGDTAASALARAKVARPQRPATILLIAPTEDQMTND